MKRLRLPTIHPASFVSFTWQYHPLVSGASCFRLLWAPKTITHRPGAYGTGFAPSGHL